LGPYHRLATERPGCTTSGTNRAASCRHDRGDCVSRLLPRSPAARRRAFRRRSTANDARHRSDRHQHRSGSPGTGQWHHGREPKRRGIVAANGAFRHKADRGETATDILEKKQAVVCDKRVSWFLRSVSFTYAAEPSGGWPTCTLKPALRTACAGRLVGGLAAMIPHHSGRGCGGIMAHRGEPIPACLAPRILCQKKVDSTCSIRNAANRER
jgi:hypothetical protein